MVRSIRSPTIPRSRREIDWEVELAVVIGRRGRNMGETEAGEYIFGYTSLNDVSARDILKSRAWRPVVQGQEPRRPRADGTMDRPRCDLGPDNLRLVLRVNGAVKQDGNTRDMYFKVSRMIAELSRGLTLEPGDVIATGTPPGVGMGRTPPEWLKPGDVMETEIVEIGAMRNVIQAG